MQGATSRRSNDLLAGGKIKLSLIDTRGLISNASCVVLEAGAVFMMGPVSEITSVEELARMRPAPQARRPGSDPLGRAEALDPQMDAAALIVAACDHAAPTLDGLLQAFR